MYCSANIGDRTGNAPAYSRLPAQARTETHLPAQVEAQASPIFICLNKSPIINVDVVVPTPPPAVPTYTYMNDIILALSHCTALPWMAWCRPYEIVF